MKLTLRLPQTTITSASALTISTPSCDVSVSYLSCSISQTNYTLYTITFSLTNSNSYSLRSLTFSLYADSSSAFGPADLYTITMYLPQSTTSTPLVYGSDYTTSANPCACSSSFTVALTKYSEVMNLNNLTVETLGRNLKGKFGFNFGANSFRESFYATTSYFEFNLGFLSTPNANYRSRNNFRCVVYNNGTSNINSLWKSLTFSMPTLRLYSKS